MPKNIKRCTRCKEWKKKTEFHKRSRASDGLQGWCKICNREARKAGYGKNREQIKRNVAKRAIAIRQAVWDYKLENPCECGESHPAALDFHHLDSDDKEETISRLVNTGRGLDSVFQEIEKCIVICANCHRKLHYEEKMPV